MLPQNVINALDAPNDETNQSYQNDESPHLQLTISLKVIKKIVERNDNATEVDRTHFIQSGLEESKNLSTPSDADDEEFTGTWSS